MDKTTLIKIGFGGAAIAILAVAAPILILAVKAGIALVALLGMGLVGIAVIQALSLMGQKLENKLIQLQLEEARRNPVPQLIAGLGNEKARIDDSKRIWKLMAGKVKTMQQRLEERARTNPNHDLTRMRENFRVMAAGVDQFLLEIQQADKLYSQLEQKVDDYKFEYGFQELGSELDALLGDSGKRKMFDKMLMDEAFMSISNDFNAVVASLQMRTSNYANSNEMDLGSGMIVDMRDVQVLPTVQLPKEKVYA